MEVLFWLRASGLISRFVAKQLCEFVDTLCECPLPGGGEGECRPVKGRLSMPPGLQSAGPMPIGPTLPKYAGLT